MTEGIVVSQRALSRAEYIGLGGSPQERTRILIMMASNAAATRHKAGNRRYGDFVLRLDLEEPEVMDVFVDSFGKDWCGECYGSKHISATDICEGCEGGTHESGECDMCHGEGERKILLPCHSC